MTQLPYLTGALPGIGGRIKESAEDFFVEEIPLYPLSGSGTHVYFRVRKVGLPTPAAVARIARHMGVPSEDIGVAGMKDAQAVTIQMMSLEHADLDTLCRFRDSQVHLTIEARHGNKLRPGHLAGNRFQIRIRGVGKAQLAGARETLDVLRRRGAPNYFGSQRFGARGDTGELGRAMVKADLKEFLAIFLGRSRSADPPDCKAARDAFDAGFHDRALEHWPRHYTDQRRALAAFKKKRRPDQALAAIDKRMRRLFVSAFQSDIFNTVLARRVETIDRVLAGDLAQKSPSGAVFSVEDAAAEQERADRFEISPTGPILGYRSSLATGEPGRIERDAIAGFGVELEDFRHVGRLKVKGSRRPLRFEIRQGELFPDSDQRGEFLQLNFVASAGCYATIVLREIMKVE